VRFSGLNVNGIPRLHPICAIGESNCILRVVGSQELVEPVVILLNSDDVPVRLYQRLVGSRLGSIFDECRTINLRMTTKVAGHRAGRARLSQEAHWAVHSPATWPVMTLSRFQALMAAMLATMAAMPRSSKCFAAAS